MDQHAAPEQPINAVAIIGMAGRFPGANDLETYWRNLRDGVESITHCSEEELAASGVDPALLRLPNFVKAYGAVDDVEMFDAAFFGYTPRDALLMDPQQRLFLQLAWEVLESAGYDPARYARMIGVYGGASTSSYMASIYANQEVVQQADGLSIAVGNELPFLTTRVSYKLDLKGPSCPVQTACSTSLVAVHLACQGLLNAECDIALAGGVSIRVPQKMGYFFMEEGILSPDGHCRPFDAAAQGTIFASGGGMVALKRLDDALADKDTILAVIRSSAINNDGSQKASFTAPGVRGQTEVIADALACAEVEPETISYIETHGTATSLGDSIEVQALRNAFATSDSSTHRCALGAVKANIGHLDAAAGIAGMIKTVLALRHQQLPPAPNFRSPNPNIPFETTPFYVNAQLAPWKTEGGAPRRAGVSAFGFGGTNAHVVLEEAIPQTTAAIPHPTDWHVVPVSALTSEALETASGNLATHLRESTSVELGDVAYTLQMGRRQMPHRRVVVARSAADAADALEGRQPKRSFSGEHHLQDRSVVFLFPGQGSQHVQMAHELYGSQAVFTESVDQCAELLRPHLGCDLRELIYPKGETEEASRRLTQTSIAQPALFVIQYALSRMWMGWNIKPAACLGHSIGEYVAACLGGVLTLEDALRLVALRGRLMESMPPGVMLALPMAEAEVAPLLDDHLWLAAVNSPTMCVVAGSEQRITEFEETLRNEGRDGVRLHTSHAFHSGLMDGAIEPFVDAVRELPRRAPRIPYISNVSGDWITDEQVADATYWGRQIRQPVRFAAGVAKLLERENQVLIEVGAGQTLTNLVRQQTRGRGEPVTVLSTLPAARDETTDAWQATVAAVGQLWVNGVAVDWEQLHGEPKRRVPLPTYPFAKHRYWVDPTPGGPAAPAALRATGKLPLVDDWMYVPNWTRTALAREPDLADDAASAGPWLVFLDESEQGRELVARLEAAGRSVASVVAGERFERLGENRFQVAPDQPADYTMLLKHLEAESASQSKVPARVLHLWGVAAKNAVGDDAGAARLPIHQSLLLLTQALGEVDAPSPLEIVLITSGVHHVVGGEPLSPETAAVTGLTKVIPQEYPGWNCRSVDVVSSEWHAADAGGGAGDWATRLLAEAIPNSGAEVDNDATIAYRSGYRWVQGVQPLPLEPVDGAPRRLRNGGVYWITGGLGDIGMKMAEYLAQTVGARLVLTGRGGLPPEQEWETVVRTAAAADTTAQRIRRVQHLQSLGAEVLVLPADAANAEQMREALDKTLARFGELHGVIHAAGLVGAEQFLPISQTERDLCAQQLRPKLDALYVLADLLDQRKVDFCLLVSSLSAVLGGLGYAAYASANAAMDAFACKLNRPSAPWLTVNWDSWLRAEDEARMQQSGTPITGFLMSAAEGIGALHRILSHDVGPQVIVSSGDLKARIDQWVKMGGLKEAIAEEASGTLRHPRPGLQTEFVAPTNATEHAIANIWQSLLGIEGIGIDDSFFELGGDSLTGLQVIAQLKQKLSARVSAVSLFEAPTVRALARLLDSRDEQPSEALQGSRSRGAKRRDRRHRRQTSAADGSRPENQTEESSESRSQAYVEPPQLDTHPEDQTPPEPRIDTGQT